ncbi:MULTISPECIES: phage terminase large subunit family protein [unclassified Yoonia]|uniref:phage terminase large subunit family protein n=1 Tax=unclassified Yoonia TaxID=2629118 RepID=UPI002AFEE256|nr:MULTISPECIES: phage terminase large subunit family protein [unclassified Yoonia]
MSQHDLTLASPFAVALAQARAKTLRPPPKIDLIQWADKTRYLSREASSTGGRWDTSRVAIARGPMKSVTEPGVHIISVMACTQLAKTELILNIVGFHIHRDPSPILCVYPTESAAETWSKDRLATMLRDSPKLRRIIDDRARASGNTILHKSFPGGQISIVGANSPTELAQRPIRLVLADEIDKFPASAGSEGDPLSLAEERAGTFPTSYLFVRVCSPTIKGASRIETSWLESDMRRPYVPCPHCDHEQVLTWKHVQWNKDADGQHLTDTAMIYCEECGAGWTEPDRLDSLPLVKWRQTRKFKCCDKDQDPMNTRSWRLDAENEVGRATCTECGKDAVSNEHAGFHINKLYSPWEPLSKLAAKFVLSKNDPERLKTFINTQLAETFEEVATETVGDEALLARREAYAAALPQGVGLLTAGVDTQDNRLEVEVVGWGQDEESWGIDYKIFPGDPSLPDVWQDLDDYLLTQWTREDGRTMSVQAAAVDTQGHHSQAAYAFCRKLSGRRVWAIQGKSDQTGKRSPVWPRKPSLKNKGRVPLYSVGTQAAKDMIFRRLALTEPGPGYTHFPATYDAEYFAQLTAEKPRPKMVGGNRFYVWQCPSGKRNEALDCRVYAYAALCGLQAAGLQLNKRVAENAGTTIRVNEKLPAPQQVPAAAVELVKEPSHVNVVESREPVRSRKSKRRPQQGFRDNVW